MEYSFIDGYRAGAKFLYVPSEKNLYYKKHTMQDGASSYICYQSILKKKPDSIHCGARVILQGNICSRNHISHSKHDHHEIRYEDLLALNRMRTACNSLRENFNEDAQKISAIKVFNREVAK